MECKERYIVEGARKAVGGGEVGAVQGVAAPYRRTWHKRIWSNEAFAQENPIHKAVLFMLRIF